MNLVKLKQIICSNKNCSVENLKQLSEKLQEESTNTAIISDLPKLISAVFKYAFHEDAKLRSAAIPAFIELVNLLDLNKHLKEKAWWKGMKTVILNSVDMLMPLVSSGDESWAVLWTTTISLLGTDLRYELPILNKLLKVVEKAFKLNSENMRKKGFECWCRLIDNFAIDRQELNNKRRLNLLVIPLKANNHNSPTLCAAKLQTWKYLLSKLDQHNELTVELVISHFLEFMFCGVATLPPACEKLNTECADMFLQLLKTPLLFRLLPTHFIKYTVICISHVCEDFELSVNIWKCFLGNMKSAQWEDSLVSTLMTCLTGVDQTSRFSKSKTYAEMIFLLYSGINCLPEELLIKNCNTVFGLVLNSSVLVHFNESRCDDLFSILARTDPVLLPENTLTEIVSTLSDLSASESFRDNKLKLLRGIWITLTNVLCKWMSDNGEVGKDRSIQSEISNVHQLLLFGAADLSTMWNKYHMKNWQTLYSESTRYFSLLPEASCDRFVSDLVELLQGAVHKKVIPLHVAVDLLSIIIEFDVSKEMSNKLPLMMAIGDCGMISLLQDISGISFLTQFLKTVVIAARTEAPLVNDILTVIEKMLKYLEEVPSGSPHEKIRNMILKAQHQLQALKPSRVQEKAASPVVAQPTASPTMTSFLHRLAKAKETQAKMNSPNGSHSSISSSPGQTPNSKKATSPFADFKSEDFVFVPPKSRKTVLTDHQKESLTTRKYDIPALYQDLSQDSSQSALESIVISVPQLEEKSHDNGHFSMKVSKTNDLEQKSVASKKGFNTNIKTETNKAKCEKALLSNKENDCVNNNTHSPLLTIGNQESNIKTAIKTALSDDSMTTTSSSPKGTDVLEKSNQLMSKTLKAGNNEFKTINTVHIVAENIGKNDSLIIDESSKRVDKKSVMDKSDHINVNLGEAAHQNDRQTAAFSKSHGDEVSESNFKLNKSNKSPGMSSANTPQGTSAPFEQITPKRNMRKNRLIISIEKKSGGKIRVKTPKSTKSETVRSPSKINEKSPNGTPKISPRRLRKRKSGITPILSSGDLSKKKKRRSSLISSNENNSIKDESNESSISSTNIGILDDRIDISKGNKNVSTTKYALKENCSTMKSASDNIVSFKIFKGNLDNDDHSKSVKGASDSNVLKTNKDISHNVDHSKSVKGASDSNVLPKTDKDISHNVDHSKSVKEASDSNVLDKTDKNKSHNGDHSKSIKGASDSNSISKADKGKSDNDKHSKAVKEALDNNVLTKTVKEQSDSDVHSKSVKGVTNNDVNSDTIKSMVIVENLNIIILDENKGRKQDIKGSTPIICSPVKVSLQRLENNEVNKTSFSLEKYKESSNSKKQESNNPINQNTNSNTNQTSKHTTHVKKLKFATSDTEGVGDKNSKAASVKNDFQENASISEEDNPNVKTQVKLSSIDCIQTKTSQEKGLTEGENKSPVDELVCSNEKEIVNVEKNVIDKNSETDMNLQNSKPSKYQSSFIEKEKSTPVNETLPIDTLSEEKVSEEKRALSSKEQEIQSIKCQTPKTNKLVEYNHAINKSNDSTTESGSESKYLQSSIKEKMKKDDSEPRKLEENVSNVQHDVIVDGVSKLDGVNKEQEISSPVPSNETIISSKNREPQLIVEKIDSSSTESHTSPKMTNSEIEETNIEGQHLLLENITDIDTNTCDPIDSLLFTKKQAQESNTPSKSGQKTLKQTQLPFTPIRKANNIDKSSKATYEDSTLSKSNTETLNERSMVLKIKKLNLPEKEQTEDKNNISCASVGSDVTSEKTSSPFEMPLETGKRYSIIDCSIINEVPRTPEKPSLATNKSGENELQISPIVKIGSMEKSDGKNPPIITIVESPSKDSESQDFIASSQENEVSTLSLTAAENNNGSFSCSPTKKIRKVPSKYEGFSYSQISNSSVRSLRSSPKVDITRTSSTPIKKSVCRRLDVEIDENSSELVHSDDMKEDRLKPIGIMSPLTKEDNQSQSKSDNTDCSEELLMNDIKLLNGENVADHPNISNFESGAMNVQTHKELDKDSQPIASSKDDPSTSGNQNSLKRFLCQSNSPSIESPKRSKGPLNLENTGSPKSPSSRTNHMMELAMKDKEQVLSPVTSNSKKRRVNPIRLGPVIKLQSVIQRKHRGPSEEWVRRTYSPTASPNSSILKRRSVLSTTVSPDSSPPSLKKKRVSFLDPPVSESLLFSKQNPGQGQVQRPEPKQDCESEEIPSQGSMQLAMSPPLCDDQSSIFSPLKECANPLTDVLERIVSLQWLTDLEEQLERLGVTTIGDLSSLTETTVLRLPFIPPKLERLKKILQNYYNEINEKTLLSKSETMPLDNEEVDTSGGTRENSTQEQDQDSYNIEEPIQPSKSISNYEDQTSISSIADKMKNYLDKHPELIQELGDRLDVDVILSILKCAVNKLKNKNDVR